MISLPVEDRSFITGRILRPCGECDQCCRVLAVESIGKPYSCACRHQSGCGCDIYADRPEDCREYHCLYLAGLDGPRPDQNGLLWDLRLDHGKAYVDCHECREGVLREMAPEQFQPLADSAVKILPKWVLKIFGGLCIFPFSIPIGAAFIAAPEYPDLQTGGMLFKPIKDGLFLYIGPANERGESDDVEGAYRYALSLIE